MCVSSPGARPFVGLREGSASAHACALARTHPPTHNAPPPLPPTHAQAHTHRPRVGKKNPRDAFGARRGREGARVCVERGRRIARGTEEVFKRCGVVEGLDLFVVVPVQTLLRPYFQERYEQQALLSRKVRAAGYTWDAEHRQRACQSLGLSIGSVRVRALACRPQKHGTVF